jgi:hypothetical protein
MWHREENELKAYPYDSSNPVIIEIPKKIKEFKYD